MNQKKFAVEFQNYFITFCAVYAKQKKKQNKDH